MAATSSPAAVTITPKPGFCIKTKTENEAFYSPLELQIPNGLKVFINICWHSCVPSSANHASGSAGSPDIKNGANPSIILSNPHPSQDKLQNPSLTIDAILHPTIKSLLLHQGQEYKVELVEKVLVKVESELGVSLSRIVGSPNLRSHEKLGERVVLVDTSPKETELPAEVKRSLIEEVPKVEAAVGSWDWRKIRGGGNLEISIVIPSNLVCSFPRLSSPRLTTSKDTVAN